MWFFWSLFFFNRESPIIIPLLQWLGVGFDGRVCRVVLCKVITSLFCSCRGRGLVVMAEAERRLGKTPLLKQPEIEEAEEEEQPQSDKVFVNNTSDACVGNSVCQDDKELPELGKCVAGPSNHSRADGSLFFEWLDFFFFNYYHTLRPHPSPHPHPTPHNPTSTSKKQPV